MNIVNQGKSVIWGGVHWQYLQDVDEVTSFSGPISVVKKVYKVEVSTNGERLVAVDHSASLQNGDLIRVVITLKSDRDMEFLHLKDMRASGFEPINVLSKYKWQEGFGYYESTKDAATHFFMDYLPKGTYVFEYDLRVNNKGDFSNGIATIENMYAPEFSSHSESIRVKVGN